MLNYSSSSELLILYFENDDDIKDISFHLEESFNENISICVSGA
jgi:hypothetical protein